MANDNQEYYLSKNFLNLTVSSGGGSGIPNDVDINSLAANTLTLKSGGFNGKLESIGISANRDYTFPNSSGNVVIDSATQTLTNKNMTSVTNSFPGSLVNLTSSQVLTNKDLTSATNTFPSSLVNLTNAQTLTNKDLTSVTNTFPSSLSTSANVQTLTNKDLTSVTNTFPSSLATLTGSQSLTNKTILAPIISSIVNGAGTLTIPTTTSFLLSTLRQWPTLQNPGICLVDGTSVSAANQFLGISFRTGNNTISDTFSTAGQSNVADMYLAQRTHSTTALTQTYANCATLWIQNAPIAGSNVTITNSDAIRVENSNVRIANGRLLSSSLGTAALPAIALGALFTDGIFSSAAGAINIATAGVLRTTINASGLVLSANSAISTSGTGTITSGSGGFTSSGPLICSGASSVTTCAVRPTNNANTGIFGTAATNLSLAVGGTAIISCTTTTTSIVGALTVSNITTGGHKISAIGTSTLQEVRGSVTISAIIPMGTFYNHGSVLFTGSVSFSSTPNMILTINQEPVGGFWDQCSVTTITRGVTSFTIGIRNNSISSTNGSCTVSYVAWV